MIQLYLIFFRNKGAISKTVFLKNLNWSNLLMKWVGIERIFFKPKPLLGTGNELNHLTECV